MKSSPYFQRAPRVKKALPVKSVKIHKPPAELEPPTLSADQMLLPLITTGLTLGAYYFIAQKMSSSSSNMMMLYMMVSSVPMVLTLLYSAIKFLKQKSQYKKEMKQRDSMYKGHLQNHRNELEDLRLQQARILTEINPAPLECMKRIRERKSSLWERSPESEDFLKVRLGLGEVPFQCEIHTPSEEGYEVDPLLEEAWKIPQEYKTISHAPVQLPLFESKIVGIAGNRRNVMNIIRVIIMQLVTHHAPSELKLAAVYSQEEEREWDWMRWLPHTWNDEKQTRFLAKEKETAEKLLEQLFNTLNIRKIHKDAEGKQQQHIPLWAFFLSADQFAEEDPLIPLLLKEADAIGACTFLFADRKEELPMQCKLIVEVSENEGTLIQTFSRGKENFDREEWLFSPDQVSLEEAEKMARLLAPVRLKQSSSEAIPQMVTLFDLFGIKQIEELNLKEKWQQNRYPSSFPVPIGFRAGNKEVLLNIHDKIEKNGHGPHGLMAGTTGSGKSEVIQTIIASLAVNYHPHEMAFMLIDYKGGGMSNTFQGLPHVIATITNLEDGNIIERAKTSLKAELIRRQKIFNEAGNLQHIDEYYQSSYREKEPLPHLFIVIDEFAQLKKEQPEFMDELISIAAVGRTLGVHLLLATQKPAGVVDDKIWSNSRFRICLRVQDDADSRDMLKIPNASRITVPGRGYLQVGTDEVLHLFQSAWSGAPCSEVGQEKEIQVFEVALNGEKRERKIKSGANMQAADAPIKRKQLDVLNEHIQKIAKEQKIEPLQGPWLEPLSNELYLDELENITNWQKNVWDQNNQWLQPIVGKVDNIATQQQYPLRLNLNEGHIAVYGMPGTGKTTFLQTMALSLALTHSPQNLHLYMIDFGKMLRDFVVLPQVGSVIQEEETEKLTRLFTMLLEELTRRKELFAEIGAKTLVTYRQSASETLPAIVVMLDGYASFRKTFEEQDEQLELLLREGANLGIYFVITANRINDFYEKIRSNIPSAISYELADTSDYHYTVGRPSKVPSQLPAGRAFFKGHIPPLQFQTAIATKGSTELERTKLLRQRMTMIQKAWEGPRATEVPVLPEEVSLLDLLKEETGLNEFAVGLNIETLKPHCFTLDDGPNALVAGRIEGGVTSSLKTILLSMASSLSPEQLAVYLIDGDPTPDGIMAYRQLPHVKEIGYNAENIERILTHIEFVINSRDSGTSFLEDEPLEKQASDASEQKILLIIDGIDKLLGLASFDNSIEASLTAIIKNSKGKNCFNFIGGQAEYIASSYDSGMAEIKKIGSGFLLGTTSHTALEPFKMRLPHHEKEKELPSGEGYFHKRKSVKVKVAYPYTKDYTDGQWVKEISSHWIQQAVHTQEN